MALARHCALMLCACGWGAPALHEPCPAVMSSRAGIASIPTGRAAAGLHGEALLALAGDRGLWCCSTTQHPEET